MSLAPQAISPGDTIQYESKKKNFHMYICSEGVYVFACMGVHVYVLVQPKVNVGCLLNLCTS